MIISSWWYLQLLFSFTFFLIPWVCVSVFLIYNCEFGLVTPLTLSCSEFRLDFMLFIVWFFFWSFLQPHLEGGDKSTLHELLISYFFSLIFISSLLDTFTELTRWYYSYNASLGPRPPWYVINNLPFLSRKILLTRLCYDISWYFK